MNLDFMPSPSPEHPGLFIRDPYHFSDAMLVIPPALVEALRCFDGEHTDADLGQYLYRVTGQLDGAIKQQLIDTLSAAGFLEDPNFFAMAEERREAFAAATVREAAHAGSAYPAQPEEMRQVMNEWMSGDGGADAGPKAGLEKPVAARLACPTYDGNLVGIAAPHVSPSGGWQSYRDAYRLLSAEHRNKTFVILATSHYGEPETFGLTRKTYRTPLGDTPTDTALVDWLEARGGPAVSMEDYCHSFEHTVEFQVAFLQHALGPDVKILPILVGSFAHSIYLGGKPEDTDGVKAFLDALGELRDREGDRLFWILGVDMAHMGARYQDDFTAIAGQGQMQAVEARDASRIERINALDAGGFWDLVRENQDDLKWCGSSPFYAFLKTAPKVRGQLLRYEQWNIDERSVVSFAGMAFTK
jgi:AmmeMemoRadiSam system protein B